MVVESGVCRDEEWWGNCLAERSRRRGRLFLSRGAEGLILCRFVVASYAPLRLRTYTWVAVFLLFCLFPFRVLPSTTSFPSNADATTKKKRSGRE